MASQIAVFTSSGTFNVPANVSGVLVTEIAGGGGANSSPGNAGGAGQIMIRYPVAVTPGGTLAVTVGAKGNGAKSGAYTNTAGGDSIVGGLRVDGGGAAFAQGGNPSFPIAGFGGGLHGAEGNTFNTDGLLAPQTTVQPNLPINGGQSSRWWGGGSGGGAGGAGRPEGNFGAPAINGIAGGLQGGSPFPDGSGSGGASTMFGQGAQGGSGPSHNNGRDTVVDHYGSAGGGGTNSGTGGDGAGGLVWLEY